jgi:2-haloalkanoic acid dehalogenase type II
VTQGPTSFDPTSIRAVGFDGYGTLFAYDIDDFRREVAVILAEQELETDFDAFFRTWVKSYSAGGVWGMDGPSRERPQNDVVLNGPLPEWHSQWEIWRRQFVTALEQCGLTGDADAAADRLRDVLTHAPAYPDAYGAIEELDRRGYTLGLLSNADEDFLQGALSGARLRFSVIQTSESLRAYKPHRASFEALCTRLGWPPQQVLYVGDSPISDISGGHNAGLRTALAQRPGADSSEHAAQTEDDGTASAYPEGIALPDITITSLTELLDLLPGLSSASDDGTRIRRD